LQGNSRQKIPTKVTSPLVIVINLSVTYVVRVLSLSSQTLDMLHLFSFDLSERQPRMYYLNFFT